VTTNTHIARAPTKLLCTLPILRTPSAPYYFSVWCQNLVCTLTHQNFSAWHQNLLRTLAHQHFSARRPKFSAHTYTPTFFRTVSKFLSHTNIFPRSVQFLYITSFYCASCIFSAPTYAHSFFCASIPREFHCRNWGFFLTFSQFHHRHSTTMKFPQFFTLITPIQPLQ
jgi:hypothetical protein